MHALCSHNVTVHHSRLLTRWRTVYSENTAVLYAGPQSCWRQSWWVRRWRTSLFSLACSPGPRPILIHVMALYASRLVGIATSSDKGRIERAVRLSLYQDTDPTASQLAEDADDLKTFSPILNIFFTMHLLPSRTHHSYKLRPRRHDCSLTVKSDAINFIRDSCLTLNSIYCLSTAMHGQNINFENRYIAISQRKIIRFRWNFVHSSRFWTGWTSRDQKWKPCIGQTPSCCYHKQEIRSVELAEFDRTYFLYVIKTQDNKAEFQHLLLPYKIIETQMTKS